MTADRLVLVKLFAFALMLLDHAILALAPELSSWRAITGAAFPLFCLAFGASLPAAASCPAVAARCLAWSVPAAACWLWLGAGWPINVLVVLGCSAAAVSAQLSAPVRVAALLVLVVGIAVDVVEGWLFGPAFVAAGYFGAKQFAVVAGRVPALLLLALYAVVTPGALLAAVVWLACPWFPSSDRRVGRWMLPAYPVHLVVLAAARSFV